MTSEEFARAAKLYGSDAAIRITLHNLRDPPGRRPDPEYVRRALWFRNLSPSDQEVVGDVIKKAAESAVFGLLTIIDGDRVVEDTPVKGDFALHYSKDGHQVLLNDMRMTPLHDLYNAVTRES